jgi:hypothetical protein
MRENGVVTKTEDALERVELDESLDVEEWDEDRDEEPVSELVEQVGRDAGTLAVCELELRAARNMPAVRRWGRDLLLAVVAAVALLTAFALVNWAAVVALSKVASDWLAPLVLAAVWLALAAALLLALRQRVRGLAWTLDGAEEMVAGREHARDEAEAKLRDSIERLAEAIAAEAEVRVREAVVPAADGVVDMGEDLLNVTDELTDSIEEAVPGGGLVNGAFDIVLLPGRLGVRIARAVIGRDPGNGAGADDGAPVGGGQPDD